MSNVEVLKVPPHLARAVVQEFEDEIADALTYSVGETLDVDDTAALAESGRATWFVAVMEKEVVAACLAEIIQFPKRRICQCIILAGKKGTFGKWAKHMRAAVDAFATEWGCEYAVSIGRRGWLREAKRYGYETQQRTFVVKRLKV